VGDIGIAIGVGLLTSALAYMGVHVTLHPPGPSHKAWWKVGFVVIALTGCILIAYQTKRRIDSQKATQSELTTIEKNTESRPNVTVNPTPVTIKRAEPKYAKLLFTFLPLGPNEGMVSAISRPNNNGVVSVEVTAKNVGTAQADNGQIWMQLCDGCRFAESPQGSTIPPDDPLVRRKIFDHLHMGVYFESTLLKIIPPTGVSSFTIALKYACKECHPLDNQHPQKLRVNLITAQ
jgi:hypothetical protein